MITRRGLVATGGVLAAAGGLAACDRLTGGQQQAATSKDVVAPAGKATTPTAAAPAAPTTAGVPAFTPNPNWTKDAFEAAMAASGRPTQISQAVFDAIQARKPAALANIERYLTAHFGSADPGVMAAFQAIPREYYHYAYAEKQSQAQLAYEPNAKPWPLGFGSVLSDYLGQAYMTQLAAPKPGETTLEVGTGSGFQSSLLSRMAKQSYSIEIIEPIGRAVDQIWKPLGFDNIEGRVGDGYFGWPEVKEGFDIIIVTCVAQYAPPELFRQLKPGGRLLIPIGQPFRRGQVLYVYTKDAEGKVHSRRDVGVFFIPMTGAMQKNPPPAA